MGPAPQLCRRAEGRAPAEFVKGVFERLSDRGLPIDLCDRRSRAITRRWHRFPRKKEYAGVQQVKRDEHVRKRAPGVARATTEGDRG